MATDRFQQDDFAISTLGVATIPSPLGLDPDAVQTSHFVSDDVRLRVQLEYNVSADHADDQLAAVPVTFEEAGPRGQIYFNPPDTTAAIVTCGGLSPGLNNVIRSVYFELTENYGTSRVLGIRNGYLGLNAESGLPPMVLSPELVNPIDKLGGTVLGSSRGPQPPEVMADFLQSGRIDMLFCVGGDGTQRGAQALCAEVARRGMKTAIVGIPKTIDNDIPLVRLTFGYITALSKAAEVIRGAHVEARDAIRGVGLVKLMGRHAGFIAAGASVVSQEVDFCLIPEIDVPLAGEHGFLASLERRLEKRGHAVVVVAEGAGGQWFSDCSQTRDASGNVQHQDVGLLLRDKIAGYFADPRQPVSLKYLDPSYFIRSVPACAYDRFLCDQMGRHAVHAAMAGKTGMLIGYEHGQFVHIPIPTVVGRTKQVVTTGHMWRAVLQTTRQPYWQSRE
jgi:6-phosphofructokinase 1